MCEHQRRILVPKRAEHTHMPRDTTPPTFSRESCDGLDAELPRVIIHPVIGGSPQFDERCSSHGLPPVANSTKKKTPQPPYTRKSNQTYKLVLGLLPLPTDVPTSISSICGRAIQMPTRGVSFGTPGSCLQRMRPRGRKRDGGLHVVGLQHATENVHLPPFPPWSRYAQTT